MEKRFKYKFSFLTYLSDTHSVMLSLSHLRSFYQLSEKQIEMLVTSIFSFSPQCFQTPNKALHKQADGTDQRSDCTFCAI